MSQSTLAAAAKSFLNAGKALEHSALQFRSYFVPSHIRSYFDIVRHHPAPGAGNGQRIAFFDFTRAEIDHVGGRYVFALVRDFEALGYLPCYRRNFSFLATMRHKMFKLYLLERPFATCSSINELPTGSVAVEMTDRRSFPESSSRRQVRVRYEARWPQSDREVPMTFFIHPIIYNQSLAFPPPDLAATRPWRVFFSGRVQGRKYGWDVMPVTFGKMPRQQILQALEKSLPPERLHRLEAADFAPGATRPPCFVWNDQVRYKIARPDWLGVLNRADFFLACPGTDMPLCHNLIEALSRGAIPILEYPEFLDPPLQHDVNCLVFHGETELVKVFEHAFRLGPEQIDRLRRGAYDYFLKHHAPGQFARRLINQPHPRVDLLLNAYRVPRPALP